MDTQLFTRIAAAYVRGSCARNIAEQYPDLFSPPLEQLSSAQLAALIQLGYAQELRMHRFKRTMGLPRVSKVLGILRGLSPSELLDIGSGRGAFLWPLIDSFPNLPVTAIDTIEHRVNGMQAVRAGGITTLSAHYADATKLPFADRRFAIVTLLEVLEHIPDTAQALAEICRVARQFVLISVPSKPDNNPEHIHLFDTAQLEHLLRAAGTQRVTFDAVPGHIIAIAKIGSTA